MGLGAVAATPGYDFGHYRNPYLGNVILTGLTVPEPKPEWQRSMRGESTPDDSSAFQLHCYDAGSFINTWTFPHTSVPGSSAHSVYGYDFHESVPAFDDDPSTDLVLQVSLEVPWLALWRSSTTGEQPVGQVCLFVYFRDRTTGNLFAVLMNLFDNRLGIDGTFAPFVADDLRTPFVSMPLNSRAGYATLSPASSSATGIPWTGLRFFRGHISQDNFRSMLHDINGYCAAHREARFCAPAFLSTNAFSDNVRSYDVALFGILHEVFRAPDANISMGIHVFDLGVWNFH
jgi:hypothetical protein